MAKGKQHVSDRRQRKRSAHGNAHSSGAPDPQAKPSLPPPSPPRPNRPLFYIVVALFAAWLVFLFWMAWRVASS